MSLVQMAERSRCHELSKPGHKLDYIIQFLAGDARKIISLGSGLRIWLRLTNVRSSGVLLSVIKCDVTNITYSEATPPYSF